MTDDGVKWDDPGRADRWVARDAARPAVQTARELAVAIVAVDTQPALVLELAGGAGSFLATFLRAFPDARGIWSDSSAQMVRHARTSLGPFGDRVGYLRTDMRQPGVARTGRCDVVICARATHSLDAAELAPFYRQTAMLLRPGGWLVNLDHTTVEAPWSRRYDEVTPRFYDGSPAGQAAHKERGGLSLSTHLDALASAGFAETAVPWRLLSTALVLARRSLD